MLRLAFSVLGGSASAALGFAGLGLALYANGPAHAAAALFGAVGAVAGLVCAGLHIVVDGLPKPQPVAAPSDEVARLVRATLAKAASTRTARPGSAAQRQMPQPAVVASAQPLHNSAVGA